MLSPSTIDESGAANASTVTATLSHASSAAVTFTVSASPGTDTVAGDFTLSAATTLTIAAGSTASTGTVTITAVDNSVDAPNKSVTVSATAAGGGVADPSSQTLTITDDETTPTATLVLSPSTIKEHSTTASETVSTVTATLSHASNETVSLTVAASPGTDTVAGDFTLSAATTLTIAAGATTSTGTVTLTAVDNSVDAPDKTVTVSATVGGNSGVANPSDQTLTITDDEGTPTVTLALAPTSIKEHSTTASETVSTVTATLSGTSSEAVTLTVAARPGADTVAGDFTLSADTTLTIAAGATSSTGTVTITAVDNSVDAPDKTVTVSATVGGNSGVANPSDQTLTITDDEGTPTVTLALAPTSIKEHSTTASETVSTVTATLSGTSSEAVTLTVAARPGADTVAGDFTLSADTTLTIAAGATSSTGTVTITAVDNSVDAPDKTVTVSATVGGNSGVANPSDQTLTITDDEGTPTVTLALAPTSIKEHSTTASETVSTVTATLSGTSSEAVTLTVAASPGADTVAGDFTLSAATTLTIAAGATSSTGTVTITAVDNSVDAPDKTVTVSATVGGNSGVANPSDQTLTITDDDERGLVLSATAVTVTEATGASRTATYTVKLATQPTAAVTVAVSSDDTGAAMVAPASLTFTTADWGTAQTVTVTGVDDAVDNAADRTTTIGHDASGGDYGAVEGAVNVTVTDDEGTPTATLVLTPSTIDESGAANASTVTATLSHASSAAVTLMVAASPGADTVAGDFTLSTNKTLTIAANSTSSTGTVTLTAVDNSVDGPDKTVTVSATASGGNGVADPSSQTLTITDDDTRGLVFSPTSLTVTEASGASHTATYTVALATQPTADVTVAVSSNDTSAATVSTTSLTFTTATWDTAQTVTVTAVDDAVNNGVDHRTTTIGHQASSGDYGSVTGSVAVSVTDDEGAPTVAIGGVPSAINSTSNLNVTFDWSENVTGFDTADVTVTGGTKGAFSGNDDSYSLTVTPSGNTNVVVTVTANTGTDGGGNTGPASAEVATAVWDATAPTVTIGGVPSAINSTSNLNVTFDWSENVTGFDTADVTVTGGTKGAFSGNDDSYSLTVTPSGNTNVVVTVTANTGTDGGGNTGPAAAEVATATWDATAPTVTITGVPSAINSTSNLNVTFTWSESVTGFDASDVTVTGGTSSAFSGSGDSYTLTVTPSRKHRRGGERGSERGHGRRRQHGAGVGGKRNRGLGCDGADGDDHGGAFGDQLDKQSERVVHLVGGRDGF